MKKYVLNCKTNQVTPIIGCDTVEEGKAIITKLTKNAVQTESKFNSVEFFISDFYTDKVLYTSPRYITGTIEDVNDINNLTL